MSIATDTYCIECQLRRNLELVRKLGDEEKATRFAREWMAMVLRMPEDVPSPCYGPETTELLHRMYGVDRDRFREEKRSANAFALNQMEAVRAQIRQA